MAVGDRITAGELRNLLAFTPTNLQTYTEARVNASPADRTRSGNKIKSTTQTIPMPVFAGPAGNELNTQLVANYINLLSQTISLRRFDFFQEGCLPTVSYSRRSVLVPPLVSTFGTTVAQAAVITRQRLIDINAALRAYVTANTGATFIRFSYCHCNCHGSCHAARGRR